MKLDWDVLSGKRSFQQSSVVAVSGEKAEGIYSQWFENFH